MNLSLQQQLKGNNAHDFTLVTPVKHVNSKRRGIAL